MDGLNNSYNDESFFKALPVGYRFVPTDEELVNVYLKNKVVGGHVPCSPIYYVQLYEFHPRDLADMYKLNRKIVISNEWYFFTSREKKYPNGKKPKRVIGKEKKLWEGRWKATGTDLPIKIDGKKAASRRSLDYYHLDKRTDWKMHERDFVASPPSTSTQPSSSSNNMQLDEWVVCKIYNKKYGEENGETCESNVRAVGLYIGETSNTCPPSEPIEDSNCHYDQCTCTPLLDNQNSDFQYALSSAFVASTSTLPSSSNMQKYEVGDTSRSNVRAVAGSEETSSSYEYSVPYDQCPMLYNQNNSHRHDECLAAQTNPNYEYTNNNNNMMVPQIQGINTWEPQHDDDDNPLANLTFSLSTPDFIPVFNFDNFCEQDSNIQQSTDDQPLIPMNHNDGLEPFSSVPYINNDQATIPKDDSSMRLVSDGSPSPLSSIPYINNNDHSDNQRT